MTANAVCSVSLDPLLALVCFEQSARTLPLVRERRPLRRQRAARGAARTSRACSPRRCPRREKLRDVPHRLEDGMPILDAALAWVVCDLRELVPAGDHEIAIGAVVAMDLADGDPLLWYRGRVPGAGVTADASDTPIVVQTA